MQRVAGGCIRNAIFLCWAGNTSLGVPRAYIWHRALHRTTRLFANRTFLDRCRLEVSGGKGGSGCTSFQAVMRGSARGAPDGANGGQGGQVFLRADERLDNLKLPKFHYTAPKGQNGGSNYKAGSRGEDLIINLPVGTQVSEIIAMSEEGGEKETKHLVDLVQHGQTILVAEGGKPQTRS
eukprot:g11268.t1